MGRDVGWWRVRSGERRGGEGLEVGRDVGWWRVRSGEGRGGKGRKGMTRRVCVCMSGCVCGKGEGEGGCSCVSCRGAPTPAGTLMFLCVEIFCTQM